MMPSQRFDRRLPAILEEISQPRTPDYFDDLLGLTARTRQRPAWTLLERWIPMVDIARQPVVAPGLPMRTIGLGLLLIGLILAAVAVLVVGSRPSLPAPFGLARNGLVAFARDGDIYLANPRTGNDRVVVAGPETDLRPVWSLDGTRFAFERKAVDRSGLGRLYVARADGTQLIEVTPEPLPGIESYAFSPDGREIAISAGSEFEPRVHVARSDGTGFRTMQTAMIAIEPAWRPPDGTEILFTGIGVNLYEGLYAFDAESSVVRIILEPTFGLHRAGARWSPDGSQIAYYEWVEADNITARTHIISADGTGDRMPATHPDAVWEAIVSWSNDETRLISLRGYTGSFEDVRPVIVPVDGSNLGIEIDYPGSIQGECCSSWEWAPDDSSILGTPADSAGKALQQVILDPVSGKSRSVPWSTNSYPAWQRLAP